jgi:ribosomal-protein-alanine N-acetyltransferase
MRRRGGARALIGEVIERARSEGVRKLFLEVDVSNTAAAALYASAGFERIGLRKRYYKNGGDALVMRLDL